MCVVAAATTVGCAGDGRSAAEAMRHPAARAAALPADQVVFRIRTGDGYWSRPRAAFEIPSLVVTGDGAVHAAAPTTGFASPTVVVNHVAPAEVAGLAAALEGDGLLTRGFGEPAITDHETTTVSVHGAGAAQTATVYALGADHGLDGTERERREQLREVIDVLAALSVGTQPWSPDRVRVQRLWSDGTPVPGDLPAWPGPDLATLPPNGGCREVTTGAAELHAAALTNPDAVWSSTEGQSWLAVVPLLPGESAC